MDLTTTFNNTTNYQSVQAASAAATSDRLSGSLNNINSQTSRKELEEAAKSFEAYFVEQVMKQVKETNEVFKDDSDGANAKLTDFYMDATISDLAKQIVEDYGGNFTDTMVEQMARNYGIDLKNAEEDGSGS